MRAATRAGGNHGNRHQTTVLASFRPTWRQIAARGLVGGSAALAGLLLGAGTLALTRQGLAPGDGLRPWALADPTLTMGLAGAVAPLVAVGSAVSRWRLGARINASGVYAGRRAASGFVPWERVTDIHAERRRRRTVVVVYARDSPVRRLPAPFDGDLLARDPTFERKLFLIQHLWETHRSWHVPG